MHGTFVNGLQLHPGETAELQDGTEVTFGAEVTRQDEIFPPKTFRCGVHWEPITYVARGSWLSFTFFPKLTSRQCSRPPSPAAGSARKTNKLRNGYGIDGDQLLVSEDGSESEGEEEEEDDTQMSYMDEEHSEDDENVSTSSGRSSSPESARSISSSPAPSIDDKSVSPDSRISAYIRDDDAPESHERTTKAMPISRIEKLFLKAKASEELFLKGEVSEDTEIVDLEAEEQRIETAKPRQRMPTIPSLVNKEHVDREDTTATNIELDDEADVTIVSKPDIFVKTSKNSSVSSLRKEKHKETIYIDDSDDQDAEEDAEYALEVEMEEAESEDEEEEEEAEEMEESEDEKEESVPLHESKKDTSEKPSLEPQKDETTFKSDNQTAAPSVPIDMSGFSFEAPDLLSSKLPVMNESGGSRLRNSVHDPTGSRKLVLLFDKDNELKDYYLGSSAGLPLPSLHALPPLPTAPGSLLAPAGHIHWKTTPYGGEKKTFNDYTSTTQSSYMDQKKDFFNARNHNRQTLAERESHVSFNPPQENKIPNHSSWDLWENQKTVPEMAIDNGRLPSSSISDILRVQKAQDIDDLRAYHNMNHNLTDDGVIEERKPVQEHSIPEKQDDEEKDLCEEDADYESEDLPEDAQNQKDEHDAESVLDVEEIGVLVDDFEDDVNRDTFSLPKENEILKGAGSYSKFSIHDLVLQSPGGSSGPPAVAPLPGSTVARDLSSSFFSPPPSDTSSVDAGDRSPLPEKSKTAAALEDILNPRNSPAAPPTPSHSLKRKHSEISKEEKEAVVEKVDYPILSQELGASSATAEADAPEITQTQEQVPSVSEELPARPAKKVKKEGSVGFGKAAVAAATLTGVVIGGVGVFAALVASAP
jgi:hypothetical protein